MSDKSRNSYEQMFQIGRTLARNIMESSDEEILSDNPETQLFSSKTSGELIYERALNTIKQTKEKSVPELKAFNLADFMLIGINAAAARHKLTTLSAANDPSLQLVASQVDELTDTDVIRIYKDLLASGVFKL